MSGKRFSSPIELYRFVRRAWSATTVNASFDLDAPARNQCAVTSLAVEHYFGGEIVNTPTVGGIHFYNRIDGVFWDLTVEQFDGPIPYENRPSSRAEALGHASPAQLAALIDRIEALAPADRNSKD